MSVEAQEPRFPEFPRRFRRTWQGAEAWCEVLHGLFWLSLREARDAGCEVLAVVRDDEDYAVCRGRPPAAAGRADRAMGPVYGTGPGAAPGVPTGRVFVRFEDDVQASDQREALEGAGYRIEQIPRHAPHAAWVVPRSGRIADALRNLDRIAALPGVANVEPQILFESVRRDG